MNRQWRILLGVLAIAMVQGRAVAHGVRIQSQTVPAIELNARFSSGKPIAHAQVTIYAPNDAEKPWQTGTTDAEGRFLFVPDLAQTGNWVAKVHQAGHGDAIAIAIGQSGLETAAQTDGQTQSDPISARMPDPPNVPQIAHPLTSTSSHSPHSDYSFLQKGLMMAAILWGCIGTALFFKRRR